MSPRAWILRGVLASLLLLAAGPTPAGDAVWRGTVGNSRVVVELPIDGDAIDGRYFYARHRRDIALDGHREGTTLRLHENAGDWTLDASRRDALTGEWVGGDGRRLPVRLERFHAASEGTLLAVDDPYGYLRVASLPLQAGRLQSIGAYRLQWYVEPTTGVELFRVVDGFDRATRERLNRVLAERQRAEIAAAAACTEVPNGEYESTTTLRRISRDIVSVSVFASVFCGGAHPDFGDSPLNVDPRTGRTLELEDVLWLGKGTPPRRVGATQPAFFEYREKVLAPWLVRTLARHHPAEMRPAGQDDCDYRDADVWEFPSWYATDAGLYVGPGFARAMRSCEYPDWSTLPWREVDAHAGRVPIAH